MQTLLVSTAVAGPAIGLTAAGPQGLDPGPVFDAASVKPAQPGRSKPVVDRTGITGNFDLRLFCAIDGYPGFETSPTMFDAVQSQLGLKLEARTTPVEVTVVDHVEKPTGN